MPPNRFESEVESFLEGSHGDRTHIKRADHHTVTPLCGTLLNTEMRSRELHAKLLVDSHSWVSGRRIEPPISAQAPLAWRAPAVTGGPGCGARGPRCPWAAGPGRTTSRRAERSSRRGRPKRAAPTPPPAEFRMQFPRSTNQHQLKNRRISTIRTQTPTCAHGKCMRNCWLTAIAGHQCDAPNPTSAH